MRGKFNACGLRSVPVSYLFAGDDSILVPLAGLRMKDDTFTEGSFNSIPAAKTNELYEPIYPISLTYQLNMVLFESHHNAFRVRLDGSD